MRSSLNRLCFYFLVNIRNPFALSIIDKNLQRDSLNIHSTKSPTRTMCTIPKITWTCPHCGIKEGPDTDDLLKCNDAKAGKKCPRRNEQEMSGPKACKDHKHLPTKEKEWYYNL